MGLGAFDGFCEWVPGHSVVVGGHGDGASGAGGDFDPVVAGAFDPVFDGLVDGLVGGGVEADGAPVSIGIIDCKCTEVVDDFVWCSLFKEFFNDVTEGVFEEFALAGVPDEDFFVCMEAVASFCCVPEGVGVADAEGGESDDASDDAG